MCSRGFKVPILHALEEHRENGRDSLNRFSRSAPHGNPKAICSGFYKASLRGSSV